MLRRWRKLSQRNLMNLFLIPSVLKLENTDRSRVVIICPDQCRKSLMNQSGADPGGSKHTDTTIHWKALEEYFLMVPSRGTINFSIQPFLGKKCIFWISSKKTPALDELNRNRGWKVVSSGIPLLTSGLVDSLLSCFHKEHFNQRTNVLRCYFGSDQFWFVKLPSRWFSCRYRFRSLNNPRRLIAAVCAIGMWAECVHQFPWFIPPSH
jgi:hypothetical protein